MQSRTAPAKHGLAWIIQSAHLYRKNPKLWALVVLFYFLVAATMSAAWLHPLGSVALSFLGPIFVAGFLNISQKLTYQQPAVFNDLFIGFRHKTARLVSLGGLMLLGFVLITMLMALIGGLEQMEQLYSALQDKNQIVLEQALDLPGVKFAVYFGLLLNALLGMAYWFATALVFFHDAPPLQAMYQSFLACGRNMLSMLVYFVVGIGAFMLLMVVIGLIMAALLLLQIQVLVTLLGAVIGLFFLVLSLLVLFPILLNSLFVSYQDIFVTDSEAPQAELKQS